VHEVRYVRQHDGVFVRPTPFLLLETSNDEKTVIARNADAPLGNLRADRASWWKDWRTSRLHSGQTVASYRARQHGMETRQSCSSQKRQIAHYWGVGNAPFAQKSKWSRVMASALTRFGQHCRGLSGSSRMRTVGDIFY
jgi:hypothetical protein